MVLSTSGGGTTCARRAASSSSVRCSSRAQALSLHVELGALRIQPLANERQSHARASAHAYRAATRARCSPSPGRSPPARAPSPAPPRRQRPPPIRPRRTSSLTWVTRRRRFAARRPASATSSCSMNADLSSTSISAPSVRGASEGTTVLSGRGRAHRSRPRRHRRVARSARPDATSSSSMRSAATRHPGIGSEPSASSSATSAVVNPAGKNSSSGSGDSGRRNALELGSEVRQHRVVREKRLPPAGERAVLSTTEHDGRRGEPHVPVRCRGLVLRLRRSARRRARLGLLVLVLGDDVGVVDALRDAVRVDTGHRAKCLANALRVVEKEGRRREVRNLQRTEHRPLAPRIEHSGGDDCSTATARSARTRLRLGRERHAVPLLVHAPAGERAVGVVRPNGGFARLLAQPDHHQPPPKLRRGSATRARGARGSPSTPTGSRRRCRGSLRSRRCRW